MTIWHEDYNKELGNKFTLHVLAIITGLTALNIWLFKLF